MSEGESNSRDSIKSQNHMLRSITDSDKQEKVHIVTDRHVVDLTGGTCTCIEDYLFDGPCRHRRKIAKEVTKSESNTTE